MPSPSNCPATDPWWSRCRVSEAAANWLTHGIGLLLALIGGPLLILLAERVGTTPHVVATIIYACSLVLVFTASTRYHFFQNGPGEYRRLIADHICIYYLIAGTYTAVSMTVLPVHGVWGWLGLGTMWALALGGTVFKLIVGLGYARFSLGLYIAMSWLGVATLWPPLRYAPALAVVLLLVGGVAYTVGTIFYARVWIGKMRYSHALWHLAVLTGSTLHYFAIRECLLAAAV